MGRKGAAAEKFAFWGRRDVFYLGDGGLVMRRILTVIYWKSVHSGNNNHT